jgi:dienelactone hydrolase
MIVDRRIERKPQPSQHPVPRLSRCGVIIRCAIVATCAVAVHARTVIAAGAVDATGLHSDITFSEYSPLSRTSEMVRRLFSPLQAWRTNRLIEKRGNVREQSINLSQEKFAVYLPSTRPPRGYALLVFVPPWEQATVPSQWIAELDRRGMIFVTAANSGNDTSVLDRREPLALLAAHNIAQHYPIDSGRVYIGGFSGGSRVAMRLALGYPDVFRGALLNAGSDPIGNAQIPLPPADLMHEFQQSTRLVYLTGKDDVPRLDMDARSLRSMQEWCVLDIGTVQVAWSGHEVPSAAAFKKGLEALETRANPAAEKLAACRQQHEAQLDDQLHAVEQALGSGRIAEATTMLEKIDTRYGGLAAPRSRELAEKLEAPQ